MAEYDVAIVGAGVIGALLARELSRYHLRVALLEREVDFPGGASKANSGILHSGYDPPPGTLMARLNLEGNDLYHQLAQDLGFGLRRTGSLTVALTDEEVQVLSGLLDRGRANGVRGLRLVSGQEARQLEPLLSREVRAGLWAPSAGIVDPQGLLWTALENAVTNGVRLRRGFAVNNLRRVGALTRVEGEEWSPAADKATRPVALTCRYLVNAAGTGVGHLAALAGDYLPVRARRGEYLILDRGVTDLRRVIFPLPSGAGKGILAIPTIHGNALLGPTSTWQDDLEASATTRRGLEEALAGARRLVPSLSARQVIAQFAGIRAVSGDDFQLRPSDRWPGLLHAAGICSPGLSAAPAVAHYLVGLLQEMGLNLEAKPEWEPGRPVAVASGRVVCRCEKVTEGEIRRAIAGPAGARTIDGVKQRTRAGMGRCQGAFCRHRVAALISEELRIPVERVTQRGPGSWLVVPMEESNE
ncbi:MAG: NAD(P)/FAD-dependent oxidoreductase [Bacillota bacterium]